MQEIFENAIVQACRCALDGFTAGELFWDRVAADVWSIMTRDGAVIPLGLTVDHDDDWGDWSDLLTGLCWDEADTVVIV